MKRTVSIVGGGIGGMTAAIALLRAGFHVDIYEQARQWSRVGAGINMTPNAVAVLEGLGLMKTVLERGYCPTHRVSRTWNDGTETSRFPSELMEQRYGFRQYMLHRADLIEALDSQIPRELLHQSKRMVGLAQDEQSATLTFEDGSQARSDLVIAADGIHSRTRQLLFGQDSPRYAGAVAYRGITPADRIDPELARVFTKWWGPHIHNEFVAFPISGGSEFTFAAILPEEDWKHESWSMTVDIQRVRDGYTGYHRAVREVLDATQTASVTALYERDPMDRWVSGRIALLGDSCHPMMPFMAQGAAMGMEDAVVLTRALEMSADVPGALKCYERSRLARTRQVQLGSRGNKWLQASNDADWLFGYNAWRTPLQNAS